VLVSTQKRRQATKGTRGVEKANELRGIPSFRAEKGPRQRKHSKRTANGPGLLGGEPMTEENKGLRTDAKGKSSWGEDATPGGPTKGNGRCPKGGGSKERGKLNVTGSHHAQKKR